MIENMYFATMKHITLLPTLPISIKTLFLIAISFFLTSCEDKTDTAAEEDEEKEEEPVITVPDGFTLDELFRPSDHHFGTWVSLAEGPNNKFYACNQHGALYTFDRPAPGGMLDSTMIDSVPLAIGHAHGLLWAFNSLYVAVNHSWKDSIGYGSGVFRLFDTDNDGQLDKREMLLELDGNGEHGPHSFKLSPDGKEIYFIAGNHTLIPEALVNNSLVPNNWDEDNLLKPYPDARGHATKIKAPGGWIAKFDPEGKDWQVISAGYRNPFDLAFNSDGELFAFDADMEWDFGMPWYRPIRICHTTSGSEFGWRTGTGKWPTYYPDALPSVVDLGQGSPTGLLYGSELNFPSRYRKGLFANDWSFGTMYFIELTPEGSSYSGKKEQFLYGIPFPLTDVIAGSDGNMYFATGGRKLASRLYRLRYTGSESTEMDTKSDPEDVVSLRALRHQLEELHAGPQPGAVTQAWTYLDHEDRFIRYAARVALDHQPVQRWQKKVFIESNALKVIPAMISLARNAEPSAGLQGDMLGKLNDIDWTSLSKTGKLDLLRAYELVLHRMGEPRSAIKSNTSTRLESLFPSNDDQINRELGELLVFLDNKEALATCIDLLQKHTKNKTLMDVEMLSDEVSSRHKDYGKDVKAVIANMPPAEAIFYAVILSHAEEGWTPELRKKYFQWYYDVFSAKGGLSFKAFMENTRQKALSFVPEADRDHYEELSGIFSQAEDMANLPQPEGPGEAYFLYDISGAANLKNYKGTFEDGKRIFDAALCSSCHRMNGEGGISGPDLTQIGTRFEKGDIVNAIFSPSEEISDQYGFTLFTMKDGSKTAGKLFTESDDIVTIMPNPYTSTVKVELATSDIVNRSPSPVSPMPPGLMNRLNRKEIADLFAYMLSGGDKDHYYYGGENGKEKETD